MNVWLVQPYESLPSDDRGMLMRTGRLARALARRGDRVVWFMARFDHQRRQQRALRHEDPDLPGVDLVLMPAISYHRSVSFRRIVNHLQLALALRREFRARSTTRPDVVVASLPTAELAAVAAHYCRRWDVPLLVEVRDLYPDVYALAVPPRIRPIMAPLLWLMKGPSRYALSRADTLVGVSESYLAWAEDLARGRGSQRGAVVPLGYADELRQEPRVNHDSPRIALFVGALNVSYDLGPVIESARRLQSNGGPEVRFVICGDGDRVAHWKEQAKDLDSVEFLGHVGRETVLALGTEAWVTLAAYDKDALQGLPNKWFEYIAFGHPILYSLNGDAHQMASELGFGVHYVDGTGLAQALQLLAADQDVYDEMQRRCVKAQTGLQMSASTSSMVDLTRELASG